MTITLRQGPEPMPSAAWEMFNGALESLRDPHDGHEIGSQCPLCGKLTVRFIDHRYVLTCSPPRLNVYSWCGCGFKALSGTEVLIQDDFDAEAEARMRWKGANYNRCPHCNAIDKNLERIVDGKALCWYCGYTLREHAGEPDTVPRQAFRGVPVPIHTRHLTILRKGKQVCLYCGIRMTNAELRAQGDLD